MRKSERERAPRSGNDVSHTGAHTCAEASFLLSECKQERQRERERQTDRESERVRKKRETVKEFLGPEGFELTA